jgi:glucose-6-phosphate isomerase
MITIPLSVIDQMGVELGKVLAKNILAQLDKPADVTGHDSSVSYLIVLIIFILITDYHFYYYKTTGLIHYYQRYRKE